MSDIWVPGQSKGRPKTSLSILVPRGYETEDEPEPQFVCRVPIGDGEVCGALFYPGQEREYQQHVGRCAKAHEDTVQSESPRARMPIFDENTWDPELAAHMREVGRRMKREGRLVVHKHERAGF